MGYKDDSSLPPPLRECPLCRHRDRLYSIRGTVACLHCHMDRIWDFMEGTRRMLRGEE